MGDFSSLPVSCNRLLVTWCRIVEGVGGGEVSIRVFLRFFGSLIAASVLGRPCMPEVLRDPVSVQVLMDIVALLPVCIEHAGIDMNTVGKGPSRNY